jgi:hypothetical protein
MTWTPPSDWTRITTKAPLAGATKPVVARRPGVNACARENRPPTACQRFLHVIGSLIRAWLLCGRPYIPAIQSLL